MSKAYIVLKEVNFFSELPHNSLETLAEYCRLRDHSKKDTLFHEGDKGEAVFVLVSGNVQLHKLSPDGKEVVIKMVHPNELFAEVILFEKDSYPVSAVALTASSVLVVPKNKILELLDDSGFRNGFIAMLMRKQRYLSERIQFLSSYDLEERFRRFLKQHYGVHKQIYCDLPKKDMAAAIGATPESLSRLIQRLRRRGMLAWDAAKIQTSSEFWQQDEDSLD